MQLVEAWIESLHDVLPPEPYHVQDIRIGVFYTAVQLSTGHVGVAFTPRDLRDTVCCPRSAAEAPAAGRLAGQDAWQLASYALAALPLRRAVGVAVLNALSASAIERRGVPDGQLHVGLDALAAAQVRRGERVAMVGAFVPFIKTLKTSGVELRIIDKHREALKTDELCMWHSPAEAKEVLAQADVVVITGSALVEGGLDALLQAASTARTVVLAGPTASPWPVAFFTRGVHIFGIRVRDGARLLRTVSEGGSGYFFADAAEKICLVRTA